MDIQSYPGIYVRIYTLCKNLYKAISKYIAHSRYPYAASRTDSNRKNVKMRPVKKKKEKMSKKEKQTRRP